MTFPDRLPPLDQNPGFLLTQVRQRMGKALSRIFRAAGHDLSPEHWRMMNIVARCDGAHQTELAERIGKDKPNVSRLLDGLEQRGYLVREPDPRDRRSHLPRLTAAGEQMLATLTPLVAGFLHEIYDPVDRADYDAFLRVLREVGDRLDDFLAELPPGEGQD